MELRQLSRNFGRRKAFRGSTAAFRCTIVAVYELFLANATTLLMYSHNLSYPPRFSTFSILGHGAYFATYAWVKEKLRNPGTGTHEQPISDGILAGGVSGMIGRFIAAGGGPVDVVLRGSWSNSR